MASTHFSKLIGKYEERTSFPTDPTDGYQFYHTGRHIMYRYNATAGKWYGMAFTTTTSTSSSTSTTTTSTSTTTTSTSTTTTSTSTSTTTSTSVTTSTSTSTTL